MASGPGRPMKFTPVVRGRILDALRAGMTRNAAAGMGGVHLAQLSRWCVRFADFAKECLIAEAMAEARMTAVVIKSAGDGDPRMALEWLKRRRKADWGDALKLEHMTTDELLEVVRSGLPRVGPEAAESRGDAGAARCGVD